MNQSEYDESLLKRKVERARFGLRGFTASFAVAIAAIACQAPLAAAEYFADTGFQHFSIILGFAAGLSILSAGFFFGVLISGLLMSPQTYDIRPELEKYVPSLVRTIAGSAGIFAALVLFTIMILMTAFYLKSDNLLFASIAVLCAAVLLFVFSVGFTLVKTIGTPGGQQALSARIASAVITGKSQGGKSGQFMGRFEWGLGIILSVIFYIIFEDDGILSLIRPLISDRQADIAESIVSGGDAVVLIFPFIIIIFAAAFAVKSIRIIIETVRSLK